MIRDLCQAAVGIVVFGPCGIAINDIRILTGVVHGQNVAILVGAAAGESCSAVAFGGISRENRRIFIDQRLAFLYLDMLLIVVIPA